MPSRGIPSSKRFECNFSVRCQSIVHSLCLLPVPLNRTAQLCENCNLFILKDRPKKKRKKIKYTISNENQLGCHFPNSVAFLPILRGAACCCMGVGRIKDLNETEIHCNDKDFRHFSRFFSRIYWKLSRMIKIVHLRCDTQDIRMFWDHWRCECCFSQRLEFACQSVGWEGSWRLIRLEGSEDDACNECGSGTTKVTEQIFRYNQSAVYRLSNREVAHWNHWRSHPPLSYDNEEQKNRISEIGHHDEAADIYAIIESPHKSYRKLNPLSDVIHQMWLVYFDIKITVIKPIWIWQFQRCGIATMGRLSRQPAHHLTQTRLDPRHNNKVRNLSAKCVSLRCGLRSISTVFFVRFLFWFCLIVSRACFFFWFFFFDCCC